MKLKRTLSQNKNVPKIYFAELQFRRAFRHGYQFNKFKIVQLFTRYKKFYALQNPTRPQVLPENLQNFKMITFFKLTKSLTFHIRLNLNHFMISKTKEIFLIWKIMKKKMKTKISTVQIKKRQMKFYFDMSLH